MGLSSAQIPVNTARDTYLTALAERMSRRFDQETGRPLGNFAPIYEARLYSGEGAQELQIDDAAIIIKAELNSTIAGVPTWTDISADFTTNKMSIKPIRFWPKNRIFRQATFIVDPWQQGNYRFTGVWGEIQPDMSASQPANGWNGLSSAQIQALAPDPTQSTGWWVTPTDVAEAVADWSLYQMKATQAGLSDDAGSNTAARRLYTKSIPQNVQDVINKYKGDRSRLALINLDGTDAVTDQYAIDPLAMKTRWAGWQTYPQ